MRITCFTAFLVLQGAQAFVPQQSPIRNSVIQSTTTSLNGHNDADGWFGPAAAAAVAGWTLATQIAFASPLTTPVTHYPDAQIRDVDSPSLLISAFGGIETVDFSMPSYNEATKGGDVAASKGIPSFNPFGSFEPSLKDDSSESADDASPAPTAQEDKAAAKAAAEAKKAEEKAAAEAEKEAKKAEKEARRLAELEKQKEAVERSKQKKTEEAAAAQADKDESAPAAMSIPSFSAPDLSDMKLPEIKVPEMPKMSFSMPKLDLPSGGDVPKFEAPEFTAPKIPEFTAPKMPEFSAPKMPSMSIPSFDAPKSSGGYDFGSSSGGGAAAPVEEFEPQEVRDARAKEARSNFLAADDEAKEVERQARALRDIANDKKKVAKELKDDACKTRLGGKFICLRPLNSGY